MQEVVMPQMIFKAVVKHGAEQTINLPQNAVIVKVDNQGGAITMWYLFNTLSEKKLTPRKFQIFGTGHEVPDWRKYCGTALVGAFVWHVFENIEPVKAG
jgi:hypothetical protein